MSKIYYPYPSDKPDKKYFIITYSGRKVYFGSAGMSDYTIHKTLKERTDIYKDIKKTKTGQNLV